MVTIYIQLLDEGSIAYRPTKGEEICPGIYKVLPTNDYNPDDEKWEFLPGTFVNCEMKALTGENGKIEKCLVATKQAIL